MNKIIDRQKIIIFSLLTICWTGVIFSFSLQPADVSSELSGGFGRWLIETFLPSFLDEFDAMPEEQLEFLHTLLRKGGHFTEFFILGVLSMLTLLQTNLRRKLIWSLGFCILAASTDETIQLFVSGRSGQITDVILDSVGAAVGIAILYLCNKQKRLLHKMFHIQKN